MSATATLPFSDFPGVARYTAKEFMPDCGTGNREQFISVKSSSNYFEAVPFISGMFIISIHKHYMIVHTLSASPDH